MAGKKFRFSLERVLKLRRHETEQARQQLALVRRKCSTQQERVAAAKNRLEDLSLEAPGTGTFEPIAFRQHAAYRQDAQQQLDRAHRDLQQLQQTEKKAQAVLLDKSRAEEGLQTLRETEKARYLATELHAENAFLDEQAISGFHRNQQAELL